MRDLRARQNALPGITRGPKSLPNLTVADPRPGVNNPATAPHLGHFPMNVHHGDARSVRTVPVVYSQRAKLPVASRTTRRWFARPIRRTINVGGCAWLSVRDLAGQPIGPTHEACNRHHRSVRRYRGVA